MVEKLEGLLGREAKFRTAAEVRLEEFCLGEEVGPVIVKIKIQVLEGAKIESVPNTDRHVTVTVARINAGARRDVGKNRLDSMCGGWGQKRADERRVFGIGESIRIPPSIEAQSTKGRARTDGCYDLLRQGGRSLQMQSGECARAEVVREL